MRESVIDSWKNEISQLAKASNYSGLEIKNEQDILKSIKSEPPEIETFFDYPTLNAEAILNENENWINEEDLHKYSSSNSNKRGRKRKLFNCQYCNEIFDGSAAYRHHIDIKHSAEQITCEICGNQFGSKSKYNRHYRIAHSDEQEKHRSCIITGCHYCMKLFDSKTQLKDHIRYKHEVHDFKCDLCGKEFSVKNKLAKHYREAHMNLKMVKKSRAKKEPKEIQCFPCTVCGKICASTTFLRVHEKSHIKIRAEDYFYCDLCGNKFRTKNPLALHIQTRHVLKLRFTCVQCPGEKFLLKKL